MGSGRPLLKVRFNHPIEPMSLGDMRQLGVHRGIYAPRSGAKGRANLSSAPPWVASCAVRCVEARKASIFSLEILNICGAISKGFQPHPLSHNEAGQIIIRPASSSTGTWPPYCRASLIFRKFLLELARRQFRRFNPTTSEPTRAPRKIVGRS